MAEGLATRSPRGHRTICLPISEPTYQQIIDDPQAFRQTLDDFFQRMPELFPRNFPGYQLMGQRRSAKQGVQIRRVLLKDGTAYSIRPSFLLPYMTARTAEVEGPLFLRKFGVPFWALARVFGGNAMFWYRLECGIGRFSVVGTTVRQVEVPEHLLADEHHQSCDGQKLYIATTVADVQTVGWAAGAPGPGGLTWPVDGRPGSGFGPRMHPIHREIRRPLGGGNPPPPPRPGRGRAGRGGGGPRRPERRCT
jgi:hypothetical protein